MDSYKRFIGIGHHNHLKKRHDKIRDEGIKTYWTQEILKEDSEDRRNNHLKGSRSVEELDQAHHSIKTPFSPPLTHHSKLDSKTRSESGYAPSIQSEENDSKRNPFSPPLMEDSDSADERRFRGRSLNNLEYRSPSFDPFNGHKPPASRKIRPKDNTIRQRAFSPSSHHGDPVSYWESKWSTDGSSSNTKKLRNHHNNVRINNLRNHSSSNGDFLNTTSSKLHHKPHHYSSVNDLLGTNSRRSKRSDSTSYNNNNNNNDYNYHRQYNSKNQYNNNNNNNNDNKNYKYSYNYSNNNNINAASQRNTSNFRNNNNRNKNYNTRSHSNLYNYSNSNNNNNNRNYANVRNNNNNDSDFLSKVQQELESQRTQWNSEIDKLLSPMSVDAPSKFHFGTSSSHQQVPLSRHPQVFNAEKNSYVDTSSSLPIFKAFVDASDYPAESVRVSLDNLGNKVVIEASHEDDSINNVAMTFTQKIPLPRYSDVTNMTAKVNKRGLVKIEIPLLFYFPQDHASTSRSTTRSNTRSTTRSTHHSMPRVSTSNTYSTRTSTNQPPSSSRSHKDLYGKSYVNEVVIDRQGRQTMEIVVKTAPGFSAKDVVVEVVDERFLVVGVRRGSEEGTIKTYGLPNSADVGAIRSRIDGGGLLIISIPLLS